MFVVRCRYGNTIEHALYASGIRHREDAEKLRDRAVGLGYDDASVMTGEEYRALFATGTRGQAYQGRPYHRGR